MKTYEIQRKHSSDNHSTVVEIVNTKAEARKYIQQELEGLMKRYPNGHVVKTTNGGLEVYHFDANNPMIITYGFIS